jgi:hypothetical protein
MKYFKTRLLFLTIPKPLKQYTLFKKDYPLRTLMRRLYPPACKPYGLEAEPEVDR